MNADERASSNAHDDRDGSTVALLLRNYRLAAGFSQAELAERAGISVAAIGSLEQGLRKSPYPVTLHNIADALGLTPDERATLIRSAKRPRDHRHATEPQSTFHATLPIPLTSFVERAETVDLERLLSMHRLVTVTGTAGVGKTRTVLQVAGHYELSDVMFIDLSPVTDNNLVAAQIASAMGVPTVNTSAIVSLLISRIGDERLLIVLDCCERVLEGASTSVLALLRSCPNLRVLATSREPLGLSNELVYRLPSLDVPPVDADLGAGETYSALQLFVVRACTADARITIADDDMKAAAGICRQLDGIPLAIELAAARAPLLGVSGLREHLSILSLDSAAKDLPARHHTMTAAIEWSFALLNDRERRLMRRLSIFAGSFTLESAAAVCADDDLPPDSIALLVFDLVRKSLVETKAAKPSNRYYLLDSVRAYAALELAAAGEGDLVAHRLADWFLHFVRTRSDHGLTSVFEMLADIDNIRTAIETQLRVGSRENVAIAGELVGSYRHLWMSTQRQLELQQLCKAVTRVLDEAAYPNVVAQLANAMAGTPGACIRTDLFEAAIEANSRIGDFEAVSAHVARQSSNLFFLGRTTEALEHALRAEEILQQVSPSSRAQYFVRSLTALVFVRTGDIVRARQTIADLDQIKAQHHASDDSDYLLMRNWAVTEIDFVAGDYASAGALCRETMRRLASALPLHSVWWEIRLVQIESELMLDHVSSAAKECRRIVVDRHAFTEYGFELIEIEWMDAVALIAVKSRMPESAAQLLACSEQRRKRLGYMRSTKNALIAEEIHRLLEPLLPKDELRRALDAGERMTDGEARQLSSSVLAIDVPVSLFHSE